MFLIGRERDWLAALPKKCQKYAMIKTYRFYSLLSWSQNGYSYQRKLLLRDNSGIQPASIFSLHQIVVLIVAQGGSVWLKDERRKCGKGLPIFQLPQQKRWWTTLLFIYCLWKFYGLTWKQLGLSNIVLN